MGGEGTASLNDTETEIYGQSTNGAGDRSAAPEDRCARDGPLLSRPNIRELLHHSSSIPPPSLPSALSFYYSCPVARADVSRRGHPHTHTSTVHHNSPRKPAATRSPVLRRDAVSQRATDSVFRRPSLLLYTYPPGSPPRYDTIPPAARDSAARRDPAAFVRIYTERLGSPADSSINSWNRSFLSRTAFFFFFKFYFNLRKHPCVALEFLFHSGFTVLFASALARSSLSL